MHLVAQYPTTSTQESNVAKVPGSEPWKTGKFARYQYYPYGDTSAEKKDAPSALHTTIIPDVNLPKVRPFGRSLHTLIRCRSCMTSSISMAMTTILSRFDLELP
jgi:hypothetical protein